jgi:hypothetical protein
MTPYFPFRAHLLYTVDRGRHGGSLLIVPRDRAKALSDEYIRMKYRLNGVGGWAMCREWVARLLRGFDPTTRARLPEQAPESPFESVNELYDSVMLFAEFLGDLGKVDGAVVITEGLDVIGFGAEITAHTEHVTEICYYPDARTARRVEPLESNGTRHRSVVRFCSAIPGATGFILSQDGGMKVVRRGIHGLEMWGDVVPALC